MVVHPLQRQLPRDSAVAGRGEVWGGPREHLAPRPVTVLVAIRGPVINTDSPGDRLLNSGENHDGARHSDSGSQMPPAIDQPQSDGDTRAHFALTRRATSQHTC